ncbi:MAG: protein kinase [Planctomycetes bacterium]|nr:protein kinase [Planctomycetota bacterium]MCC7168878.1 protein kinase [Planctomycetota bacterium]
MPVLIVETGSQKGHSVTLDEDVVYTLGRDERAEVRIDDELASRAHCKIRGKEGRFFLKDAGSKNGTLVNGATIGGNAVELKSGDKITIGTTALTFFSTKEAGGGVGRTLGGYKLLQRLGRGGMGTVYRALQLSLNREVALKILSPELSRDPAFVERFLKEARAAGQLNHPNIVQVYDVAQDSGLLFYAMEFVPGGTVEDKLNKDGPMPWAEALKLLNDAARGLQYAELKKIVHRDIKPDNLMLTEIGTVKIADLGLALAQHDGGDALGIVGTPHFISPEQARGQTLDTRSDLYSLGATFFRILTGKTMFHGESAEEIVKKQLREPPPDLRATVPQIPEKVAAIFTRLVQKEPGQRYQTAGELVDAIHAAGAKKSSRALVIVLALLVVVGGTVAGILLNREPEQIVVVQNNTDQNKVDRLQTEAEKREFEFKAMTAYTEFSERAATYTRDAKLSALTEIVSSFSGTEAAGKAQKLVEQIQAEIAAETAAAAQVKSKVDAAILALENAVNPALGERRFIDAVTALTANAAPDPDVDAAADFVAAKQRLSDAALAAITTATQRTRDDVAAALAAAKFQDARAAVNAGRTALQDATALAALPQGPLAAALVEFDAALTALPPTIDTAEQSQIAGLLAQDLVRLEREFDWDAWFANVSALRFAEANDAVTTLSARMQTAAYRDYVAAIQHDVAPLSDVFGAFRSALESGQLARKDVTHPERDQAAEMKGLSDDGDGVTLVVAKSAGSASSVVRFRAFASAQAFADLLGDRVANRPADRLAIARGATLLSAAWFRAGVTRLLQQMQSYDASQGWSDTQKAALADVVVPVIDLQHGMLKTLIDEAAAESTTSAQTQAAIDLLTRESAAYSAIANALAPFLGRGGSFDHAATALSEFAAQHRGTRCFLAAYPLFDGGRCETPLVGP